MEEFRLGNPAIVCRWRLSGGKLPLESRHLRALSGRKTTGEVVSPALVAWAKQHLEWTLESGSAEHPDGVLMLVVDEGGKAAMTVGEYAPLAHTTANDLLLRAASAWKEAEETHVSPEDLWLVRGETLVWCTSPDFCPSGSSSLIDDLARTLGMTVTHEDGALIRATAQGFSCDEAFLVSDEHGVVPASDRCGMRAQKFAASYQKLLHSKRV